MRIVVCIATCNRNEGLAKALDGVARQDLPDDIARNLRVLVVDNNAAGGALELVESLSKTYAWPLHYVHERRRGVSHARNAALENTDDADFIAFLDDDEVPEPCWLRCLVDVQRRFGADVVGGPVLPRYDQPPPRWLAAGRFLDPVRHADGATINVTYTGNVLFRRALVMRLGLRFNDALALIGGEDVDFFDRLQRAGAALRYCDRAVAHESVPPHRMTLRWLLRRWFRTGNSEAILYMDRHAGLRGRVVVAGRGAVRVGLGSAAAAAVFLLGGAARWHWVVARLYTVARGLGMISSAFSIHYYEYAN